MTETPLPGTTAPAPPPTAARAPGRPQSREDKHHSTSLRIEQSAVSLVLEHGFDQVTVDMICSKSGISQRTFFNYFKTKQAAIIGVEPPTIDEGRARAFIAAPGNDVLPDLLALMSAIGPRAGLDEQLFADRMRICGLHPQLMREQMERMTRVTAEIIELVFLRLERSSTPRTDATGTDTGPTATVPGASEADRAFRHGQAELITHAMLGVVHFLALQGISGPEETPRSERMIDGATSLTPAVSRARAIELLRYTLTIPGL
ncbi:TetR/AcrR family transcriptional regulator [Cryobacterium sp. PH29-G1]|uniref:TetR/AcrR family transcriptional regulator n=1 Tax=Cryobacterium sp. PH29-G1 TaxID=3046211 RepID=UPI0024B9263E|nr:TetR/AcrR family transcriptional regulator [Cryobacterium sp. PH29-G1]MDJ0349147.1 TetR family transcriptional regulator [Cryobacterium sp. PH29-G1]